MSLPLAGRRTARAMQFSKATNEICGARCRPRRRALTSLDFTYMCTSYRASWAGPEVVVGFVVSSYVKGTHTPAHGTGSAKLRRCDRNVTPTRGAASHEEDEILRLRSLSPAPRNLYAYLIPRACTGPGPYETDWLTHLRAPCTNAAFA